MKARRLLLVLLASSCVGVVTTPSDAGSGRDDGGVTAAADAGQSDVDAGAVPDASIADGSIADAGRFDGGVDAGAFDAGVFDAGPVEWVVPAIVLAPGSSVNLGDTLPSGTLRGGRFEVLAIDPQTQTALPPLPSGVLLDGLTGVLRALPDAGPATTQGVRFSYDDLH